jgi:hypothetical protein
MYVYIFSHPTPIFLYSHHPSLHPDMVLPLRPQTEGLSPHSHLVTPLKSRLFSLPLEIRRQIYGCLLPHGVHAYLDRDNPRLSACNEPCASGGDGHERRDEDEWRKNTIVCPIWERRLQSTWGSHWRCEEMALDLLKNHDGVKATDICLLRVSQQVYVPRERSLSKVPVNWKS